MIMFKSARRFICLCVCGIDLFPSLGLWNPSRTNWGTFKLLLIKTKIVFKIKINSFWLSNATKLNTATEALKLFGLN